MKLYAQFLSNDSMFKCLSVLILVCIGFAAGPVHAQNWGTVTTTDGSTPTARHESGAVVYDGLIYLFGGRGDRPVDRYNPSTNTWETISNTPVEMHHFQPVVHNNKIYIIGAFTCCFPREETIPDIFVFDPADNTWSIAGTLPTERLRGSAGTVSHNNKIYLVGGNTNGHDGGAVGWFDEYDPATGIWTTLEDAPTARDHFGAVVINNNTLVATGGRQSSTRSTFAFTVSSTDRFDFTTNQWSSGADIPTNRAGTTSAAFNGQAIIIGGESVTGSHDTVEVYNPATNEWVALASMLNSRHAGGVALLGTDLHVFVGSRTRGGGGETNRHEVIDLALAPTSVITPPPPTDTDSDGLLDEDELNTYLTNINLADTDRDSINDFDEVFVTSTDPTLADSDGDNIDDQEELDRGLDPNNPDSDNDNLTDGDEVLIYFTNPDNPDSDGDGLTDDIEINQSGTDPLSTDSDNDGLSDAEEYNELGTDPSSQDSDADGLSDEEELNIHSTNPNSNDSDNDGISDGDEIEIYQSNPNNSDSDGDGVSDGQEIASGSSLTNLDDDNDGLVNSRDGVIDSDGDGLPNYADRDSDNDGIPDVVEAGFTDINFNGQIDTQAEWEIFQPTAAFVPPIATSVALDTDGDGVADFIDLDSDQDGIPDLAEASANYSSAAATIQNQTDNDQDGLNDNYNENSAAGPSDVDNDNFPNHLDLDSDNDDISDLLETGSPDIDNNGQIDNYIDLDGDGLTDNERPVLGNSLSDTDNDSVPDLIDSAFNSNDSSGTSSDNSSGISPVNSTGNPPNNSASTPSNSSASNPSNNAFGCALVTTNSSIVDPTFFVLLLFSLCGLAGNRMSRKIT